jgi:hypothetical protein
MYRVFMYSAPLPLPITLVLLEYLNHFSNQFEIGRGKARDNLGAVTGVVHADYGGPVLLDDAPLFVFTSASPAVSTALLLNYVHFCTLTPDMGRGSLSGLRPFSIPGATRTIRYSPTSGTYARGIIEGPASSHPAGPCFVR